MGKEIRFNTELLLLAFALLLTACGFVYKKHVVSKYYIIGVDSNTDLSLSYKLDSGDFIGRVPGELIAYGYNDAFIVAKVLNHSQPYATYYIIDRRRDSELASEKDFLIGPISESDFNSTWKKKLNIQIKKITN